MKRTYRQQRRAEDAAQTRQRIVEAAAELHRTVGPRATKVTEIARRAGVDRVTVYKHFPDEAALVNGCQAHWLDLHPLPDLSGLAAIPDPDERLRAALLGLWDWYARTRDMTANVLRDAPAMPSFKKTLDEMRGQRLALADLLGQGRPESPALRPALMLATDFRTWEVLVAEGELAPPDAAEVVALWIGASSYRCGA